MRTHLPPPVTFEALPPADVGWAVEDVACIPEDLCLRCQNPRGAVGKCTPTHRIVRFDPLDARKHRWADWDNRTLYGHFGVNPALFRYARRADPESLEWLSAASRICLGRGHLLSDTHTGAPVADQWVTPCLTCGRTPEAFPDHHRVLIPHPSLGPSRLADPCYEGRALVQKTVPDFTALAHGAPGAPASAGSAGAASAAAPGPVYRIPEGHPAAEHPYPLDCAAVDAAARVIYARTGRTGWDGEMDDLVRHHFLKTAQMVLVAAVGLLPGSDAGGGGEG